MKIRSNIDWIDCGERRQGGLYIVTLPVTGNQEIIAGSVPPDALRAIADDIEHRKEGIHKRKD